MSHMVSEEFNNRRILPCTIFNGPMMDLLQGAMKVAELANEEVHNPRSFVCLDDETFNMIMGSFNNLYNHLEAIRADTEYLAETIRELKVEDRTHEADIYG